MDENIKYISSVEIEKLWGVYDLTWNLNSSVSILSGINGSGKSTLLDCIAGSLIYGENMPHIISKKIESAKINFTDGTSIIFNSLKQTKNEDPNLNNGKLFFDGYEDLTDLKSKINIDIISTFDNKVSSTSNELKNKNVRTELDRELFHLQIKYLSYQLNASKRALEIIKLLTNPIEDDTEVVSVLSDEDFIKLQKELTDIKNHQSRFINIINDLFNETEKVVNKEDDELSFIFYKQKISVYDLSAGEKQMLVILLTALVENNESSIIFMDEPEISLHFDWQRKLISNVRILNPNAQLIIATHSPAMIIEGWVDNVTNIMDIKRN